MIKPARLREIICAYHPHFKQNPEQLEVYLTAGRIESTGRATLGYRYHYALQVLALDFNGSLDDLTLPILLWAREQQPELVLNPERNQDGITFKADILSDSSVDVLYTIQASEAVVVHETERGRWRQEHRTDPQVEWQPSGGWTLSVVDGGIA
ncbi:MAG: phage tail protein [Aeromonas sp.]